MELNHWQKIEALFHEALQLKAEERASYLAQACSDDELLRREVESLVMAFEQSFMEQPALSLGMMVLSDSPVESLVGRAIGKYKILRLLGKGGMGEVYLAEDCKLERPVALKFFKDKLVDDGWAKEQLTKEARAVAKFEHSNVCAVYGIEEIDDYNFIVMQFIEGETLASLLSNGALELTQVFDLTEQILSALSAAQVCGIIHRDIKPQNIIVTAEGQVKILDFGLAKFIEQNREKAAAPASQSVPQNGVVVGTLAYMSPEQLLAEELDCRSDIFSFGIILYEMMSGANPFKRESKEETISAIKESAPPPIRKSLTHIPDALERITLKCLEKNREQRYETADELLIELRNLRSDYELGLTHPWKRWVLQQRKYSRRYLITLLALALLLAVSAAFAYFRLTQVQTLAVLPLESQSPDSEYLSEGLTKSLIDRLSRFSKLRVAPSTVVSLYKGGNIDPVQAGRELKVDAVLVGSFVKQDDVLQLHLRLLKTADGSQLWEETSTIKTAQIMPLQDEIIRSVVSSMRVWISNDEKRFLTKHPTDNPEALGLYMRGQFYWNRRNEDNIKLAIKYFNEATEADPLYAQAYAGLADSYMFLSTPAYGAKPSKEVVNSARAAVEQALNIDNMLCEAHTSLGVIKMRYDWKWQEAEKEFLRAIELNPNYPPAHFWYSNLLLITRRTDEAIRQSEINRELDPLSTAAIINLGRAYYFARQYDKAIGYFNEVLEQKPDDNNATYLRALAYIQKGMYPACIESLGQLYSTRPIYAAAPLGYAYAKMGNRPAALAILAKLEEISQTQHVPAQEKAIICIGLNDKNRAFMYLEESYEERFPALIGLISEPLFDDLRSDPRYADMAQRLGLAPPESAAH